MEEKWDVTIVDQEDNIIWYKKRWTLDSSDIYRVSALRVTNSIWEILLAQRKWTKKKSPGKRWPAVAGTNEKWESYDSNILKETMEEIWITDKNIQKAHKTKRFSSKNNYFLQRYTLKTDRKLDEFTPSESEVEQIKRFSKNELLKLIENQPDIFVRGLPQNIMEFGKT